MAERQPPATQREMIYQLWYTLLGSNGEGTAAQVHRVEKKLNDHLEACVDPKQIEKLTQAVQEHMDWHMKGRIPWAIAGGSMGIAAMTLVLTVVGVI